MLAVSMGLLGGILPALRAVRLNIVTALRER
jgi:ABC-type antimicrobial peptide transport system permease subunit